MIIIIIIIIKFNKSIKKLVILKKETIVIKIKSHYQNDNDSHQQQTLGDLNVQFKV